MQQGGLAISCTSCSSVHPSCFGETVSCSSKHVCISVYQSSTAGGSESFSFTRGCGEKNSCEKSGTFSVPTGRLRFSTTCCDSNFCTPFAPLLPVLSNNTNGVSCPFCASITSTDCKGDRNINCMGEEKYCAMQSIELKVGSQTSKTSIRGCSSKGFCDVGTQKTEFGDYKQTMVTKCGASAALHSAVTLLILVTASLLSNVS
ncbi:phospholipase A2 inhibitor gamma subunit B-like [Mantella aurantiaca]